MLRRFAIGWIVLASASAAAAAPGVNVTVKGTRVHLGDLVVGLAPEVAGVDMGPSPASTGTRVITHDEISQALDVDIWTASAGLAELKNWYDASLAEFKSVGVFAKDLL